MPPAKRNQKSVTDNTVGTPKYDVIIVGGGVACGYTCRELAALNMGSPSLAPSVLVLTKEPYLPYERSTLISEHLSDSVVDSASAVPLVGSEGSHTVQTAKWYRHHNMTVMCNAEVVDIGSDHRVYLASGDAFEYQHALLMATGSHALKLPVAGSHNGETVENMFYVRNWDDITLLSKALEEMLNVRREDAKNNGTNAGGRPRVVIAGGGLMGVEVAAALHERGAACTLVHRRQYLLDKVHSPEVSEWYRGVLESRGVSVIVGDSVVGVEINSEGDDSLLSVSLGNAGVGALPADIVVGAIGCAPNASLLRGKVRQLASFPSEHVVVNRHLETSQPGIFAIGDLVASPLFTDGNNKDVVIARPHVDFARLSAAHVAASIMARIYNRDPPPLMRVVPHTRSVLFCHSPEPVSMECFGWKGLDSIAVQFGEQNREAFGTFWFEEATDVDEVFVIHEQQQQQQDGDEQNKNKNNNNNNNNKEEQHYRIVAGLIVGGVTTEVEAVAATTRLAPLVPLSRLYAFDLSTAFECLEQWNNEEGDLVSPLDLQDEGKESDLFVRISDRMVDVVGSLQHTFAVHCRRLASQISEPYEGLPVEEREASSVERKTDDVVDVHEKEPTIPRSELQALCMDLDLVLTEDELREARQSFPSSSITYAEFERWWLG